MHIIFITTGGTIDKDYPHTTNGWAFEFGEECAIERLVRDRLTNNPTFTYEIISVCKKDSLEITDDDRDQIWNCICTKYQQHQYDRRRQQLYHQHDDKGGGGGGLDGDNDKNNDGNGNNAAMLLSSAATTNTTISDDNNDTASQQDAAAVVEVDAVVDVVGFVITHGTDTLIETAQYLTKKIMTTLQQQNQKLLHQQLESSTLKPPSPPPPIIVMTGAMRPERFTNSDAPINVGMAIGAVQMLVEQKQQQMQKQQMQQQQQSLLQNSPNSTDVYVAMSGVVKSCWKIQRNLQTGQFY